MDRGQLFSCLSLTELIFCCLIKAQLLCEMFFRMHFSTGNTSFSSQAFWKMFVLNCKERKKRGKKEPRVQTRDMPPIVRIIMMTILLLILKGNFFFLFFKFCVPKTDRVVEPSWTVVERLCILNPGKFHSTMTQNQRRVRHVFLCVLSKASIIQSWPCKFHLKFNKNYKRIKIKIKYLDFDIFHAQFTHFSFLCCCRG